MRYQLDRRVLSVAVVAIASLALAQAQEPTLRIVSPQDGDAVAGANVEIRMQVQGVQLTPRQSGNAAYVLLRLNDLPPVKGYSDSFTFQDVAPGSHVVRVELRRADGTAFREPIRAQVRFTVRPPH